MGSVKTPAEELACLNATATAIYREMQAGQARKREGKAPKVIGADEFTPIFIYVVCLSGLTDLHARCENLWALAAPSMLSGMDGYYLTQLQAALGFLDEMYTEESSAAKKGSQLAKAPYAAVIESQVSRSSEAARAEEAEEAAAQFLASCGAAGVSHHVFEAFRQASYPPEQWLAELESLQKESQLDALLGLCRKRDRQTQFMAEMDPDLELEPEPEPETEQKATPEASGIALMLDDVDAAEAQADAEEEGTLQSIRMDASVAAKQAAAAAEPEPEPERE